MALIDVSLIFYLIITFFINLSSLVHGKSNGCSMENARNCLKKFQPYLDRGTKFLANVDETEYINVCFIYSSASTCVTSFMYFCPNIKEELHERFEMFEYACTADREADSERWPMMPTVDPELIGESEKVEAEDKKEKLRLNIIQSSLAAGATLFLILSCVIASRVSKWKLDKRIQKRQKTNVEIKVLSDQEKLLQSLIESSVKADKNAMKLEVKA